MFITDWKKVAATSWAMWAFYVLFAVEAISLVVEAMGGTFGISEATMSLVVMIGSACGGLGRLIYQGIQEERKDEH